jgi:V-type H+-transporting ATPase subunit B
LLLLLLLLLPGHGHGDLIAADEDDDAQFAIVFAAMGVNMETAHFFKQVSA